MTYANDISIFLKFYFEFSYFLCLSPFRFKLNSNNEFIVRSWLPHKLFCGLISIFCCLWILSDVYSQIQTPFTGSRSAINCFYTILGVLTAILNLAFIHISWFSKKRILKIVNCVHKNEQVARFTLIPKIVSKWIAILICFVYTLFSIFSLLNYEVKTGDSVLIDKSYFISTNFGSWWSQLVEDGYHIFFLGPHHQHSMSGIDFVFGTVAAMTILQR